MKQEKTLSEKRKQIVDNGVVFYYEEDVKEFIKEILNWKMEANYSNYDISRKEIKIAIALFNDWKKEFINFIKQKAGDKLI